MTSNTYKIPTDIGAVGMMILDGGTWWYQM